MLKKALFIVFEGIEGCGKSFQSKNFIKLKNKKYPVLLTREPGGTKSAELIRDLILKDYFNKKNDEKFDRYTDTLLYLASRNEHVKNKIIPAIKSRKIIICDRFIDSTIAYQVFGKKISKKFIDVIHNLILRKIKPDLTFVLKVSINKSIKRLKARKIKNRYDKFPKKFYEKAQKAFLKISKKSKRHKILDSSKDTPDLEKKIMDIVLKKIKKC